jgi:hypothetical protein
MNNIRDKIYSHVNGKISIFCSLNTLKASVKLPQKITPYLRIELKYARYYIRSVSKFKI